VGSTHVEVAMSARYEFGPFRLDPKERLLLREGQPVPLSPKAFDLLVLFVQAPGRLLEKRNLMQALWPDTFVEESNLAYNVSAIRKALGDGLDDQQFVATVPTRGYRFVAQVRELHDVDAPVAPKRRLSVTPVFWAVLLAVGVVALAVAILTFRDVRSGVSARAQGATRFPLLPPPGAAFGVAPADPHLAVSPDGRSIAFIASRADVAGGLWVRDLGAVEARLLPGITGAAKPFWSPDGRSLGFFRNQELHVVPATGGPAWALGSGVAGIGGAWSPDDVIVFAPSPSDGLHRIPASGGAATRVTTVDAERGESHRFPVFLPDGRRFLYLAVTTIPNEERRVCIASVDGRDRPACLVSVDSNALLAASGHLLFVRGSTLWRSGST
jgi:DNA-binding winged helix-turn-helix (wHTH) protein